MSIVPKETIEVIAQSLGIINLSPEVSESLAPDVEYRVREIMQEAIKCMRHSKRTILTADDVDSALRLRNVEPLYGFASNNPLRLRRAVGHKDLFYVDDKDLEFKEVIETPLPRAPPDTRLYTHWLAIEGVQPIVPANPPIEALAAQPDGKKFECKEDGLPVDVKLPAKHVLSKELQLYFDKVIELTMRKSDSLLFKEALLSLSSDPGLHPLVPYFTYFIADEVSKNLHNFTSLFGLMRVAWSLLQNRHIHIEPYLHQLMPSVITCLVAKKLGNKLSDNHWELRNFSANLVATICRRFGYVYHNLQPRVTRTLLHAFLDPTKGLAQHYGAIQGLAALGPRVVHLLILPNLKPFMQLLEPEMLLEKQKNELKRQEAWRVYGSLLFACGQCLHDQIKKLPRFPFLSARINLRSKPIMTHPNKRKLSMDNLVQQQQSPLKKLATDSGPVGMAVSNSSYGMGPQQQQGQVESRQGRVEKMAIDGQPQKPSSVLAQTLKESSAAGQLLASLLEHFGQDLFPFIPAPELSLFL